MFQTLETFYTRSRRQVLRLACQTLIWLVRILQKSDGGLGFFEPIYQRNHRWVSFRLFILIRQNLVIMISKDSYFKFKTFSLQCEKIYPKTLWISKNYFGQYFFDFQFFHLFRFFVIILKNLYFTAPGIRTAMGLDRGKGTAFVLKSDITYKQWNMGSNATALDSKG